MPQPQWDCRIKAISPVGFDAKPVSRLRAGIDGAWGERCAHCATTRRRLSVQSQKSFCHAMGHRQQGKEAAGACALTAIRKNASHLEHLAERRMDSFHAALRFGRRAI
jgi:hypothetical protein